MLAPSLEAFDGCEALAESLGNDISELLGVWLELNPLILDVGSDFTV